MHNWFIKFPSFTFSMVVSSTWSCLDQLQQMLSCLAQTEALSYSAGCYPGQQASQIMSHGKEQLPGKISHMTALSRCSSWFRVFLVFIWFFGDGERETSEGPWGRGCSTQSPLLCAYTPTLRPKVDVVQRVKPEENLIFWPGGGGQGERPVLFLVTHHLLCFVDDHWMAELSSVPLAITNCVQMKIHRDIYRS